MSKFICWLLDRHLWGFVVYKNGAVTQECLRCGFEGEDI